MDALYSLEEVSVHFVNRVYIIIVILWGAVNGSGSRGRGGMVCAHSPLYREHPVIAADVGFWGVYRMCSFVEFRRSVCWDEDEVYDARGCGLVTAVCVEGEPRFPVRPDSSGSRGVAKVCWRTRVGGIRMRWLVGSP